jgi:hypothetical protein
VAKALSPRAMRTRSSVWRAREARCVRSTLAELADSLLLKSWGVAPYCCLNARVKPLRLAKPTRAATWSTS